MFGNNRGNAPYYFCFAAGVYMGYIIHRMFTQLDGAAEAKHWVLAVVLGLIALGMIAFGGYHVFFRKPEAQKPEEPQQIAEPASETEE